MDNTWVHCYPCTKFCHCSPYIPLDICPFFLLLAIQNKNANEIFNMRIQWWQTPCLILVPTTTHIKCHHCSPYRTLALCLFCSEPVSTNMQMRYLICALTMTEHTGTTWVHYYHIPSFVIEAHTELWVFAFFVITCSQYANEVLNMTNTEHMGNTFKYYPFKYYPL